MKTVNPDRKTLKRLWETLPRDTPIIMLNLLKYREKALYPAGSEHTSCSGREAYERYSEVALKKVKEVGGEPVWGGRALGGLIAPEEETWDEVLLVRYPSIDAFFSMLKMPDYDTATVHRSAALEDSRLIATTEIPNLGRS